MPKLESKIEAEVIKALAKQKAMCHKLTASKGDPDRIVIWVDNAGRSRVFYMELKTSTGAVSKAQEYRHSKLLAPVYVVRSVAEAIAALKTEQNTLNSV